MGKPKKKRALSDWNKFIRDNSHLAKFKLTSGSPDLKKMSAAFHGKRGSKAKPKKKTTTTRRVTATTKKSEKKVRKTAPQKAKTQSVPVSALEKRSQKLFQRAEQVRLALGIPKSNFSIMLTNKGARIKIAGMKPIKRRKLSDAVKALETMARSKI